MRLGRAGTGTLIALCVLTTSLCVTTAPAAALVTQQAADHRYVPLAPARVLDTRIGLGLTGPFGPKQARTLTVAGQGGLPATGIAAVVLNLTATEATRASFVTAWRADLARPLASSLNFLAGETVPNLVVVPVDAAGQIALYNEAGSVHLIADVAGWFPTGGEFHVVGPTRVLDTREGLGASGPLGPGGVTTFPILGVGGVPAEGVGAVAFNLTGTDATRATYVTSWPTGQMRPTASNLNLVPGSARPNLVIVPVGAGGTASLYNDAGAAHLIADVVGWFPANAGDYHPQSPQRVLDSRTGVGLTGPLGAGVTRVLPLAGFAGIPATGARAVVLNVTATEVTAAAHVTIWPDGDAPNTSNLNVLPGGTRPNTVIVPLGADGAVRLRHNAGSLQLIADVLGWFGGDDATPPGDVVTGSDVGWRFVPSQMILAPGQTATATLVQTDLAGQPTGSALPAGTTFQSTAAGVTVTSLGGTTVQVTAGNQITTSIVAAQIPGWPLAPTLAVTVANVRPEVLQIPDGEVAFPEPDLPLDGDVGDLVGDHITEAGVGPFTWAELVVRNGLPDGMEGLSPEQLLDFEVWYPVVLRRPAPALGSLVLGTGGSAILGKVVDPGGLPSLEREGPDGTTWSLVSVQLVGLQEIYLDLDFSLTYDDLVAIGAVPPPPGAPEPFAPLSNGVANRSLHRTTNEPSGDDETVAGPGNLQRGGGLRRLTECADQLAASAAAGLQLATFNPAVDITLNPILNAYVNIVDGGLTGLRFEIGASVSATLQAVMVLQTVVTFTADCTLADLVELEVVAPGPLAPFLSVTGETKQKLTFGLTVSGGPKLEVGAKCSAAFTMVAGFAYESASNVTTDLGRAERTGPSCEPVWKPDVNAGSDGLGVKVTGTVGLPLEAPMGVRAGGKVAGAIGRLFSWFSPGVANLGKVKAITAQAGPQLRTTWENETNAMAFEAASSQVAGELYGKVFIDVEPLVWLLKKFGPPTPDFQTILYQETEPVFNLYLPLNPVRTTATVGGDDTPLLPAVYVQEDDEFELRATLGPTGTGLSVAIPQLTDATVYRVVNTATIASNLFDVDVVASDGEQASYGVTTIKVSATITEAICDELRAEPVNFKLVGDAPLSLFGVSVSTPAYGGAFSIQCVDGKIEWDPETITDLSAYQDSSVTVVTSGPKDDTFEITGAPSWLGVTPSSGVLEASPDISLAFNVELKVLTGGGGQCWESRTATLTIATEHRGSKLLQVTEEPPCTVEWSAERVDGPGVKDVSVKTRGGTLDNLTFTGLPDWLTISPPVPVVLGPTGIFFDTHDFTLHFEERERTCQVQLPRNATITATTSDRGSDTLLVVDPKVDPYADCGLRFTPNQLTGSGSSQLTVRDDLLKDGTAQWSIDASALPDWLGVLPTSGTVSTASPATVGFAVLPTPFDPCVGRPAATTAVTATTTFTATFGDQDNGGIPVSKTLHAQITITRPAIEPTECPRTEGHGKGDPHLSSMDGVAFEGQIIGEYVYSRTPAGGPNPFELVVRSRPTSGASGSVAPTSISAIALTRGGHRIEVYGATPWPEVLIDGDLAVLPDGSPLQVAAGTSVVRNGTNVRIDLPNVTVTASSWGPFLDLVVSAAVGTPMEGLLGSPDGNPANDFVGADGTPYTVTQVVNNELPAFFDYVASWRITDPDESPFSRPSEHFAVPNPGFSQEILDTFGPQVDAAIQGVEYVCSGELGFKRRYGLALELAIGTDPTHLEQYVCSYAVSGYARADGQPTTGLLVTVDGPGLHPCTTSTGVDGRYHCRLVVDLAEVRDLGADVMPLQVSVVGRWPGLTSTAAAGSAQFTSPASIGGGASVATVDLDIDPDSVPRVVVSGVVKRDGTPLAGDRTIHVQAHDTSGALLLNVAMIATVSPDDGSYSFTRYLPPTTSRVTLFAIVDSPVTEYFTKEVTGLHLGPNPVTFDVDYAVPLVTVRGTITDGSAGLPGSHTVRVVARDAGGTVLGTYQTSTTADPATGAYEVVVPVSRLAAFATATVLAAPFGEPFTSALTPLAGGTATIDLNASLARPLVRVTGSLVDEHGTALTDRSVTFRFRNAGGTVVHTSFTTVSGPAYLVERQGPATSASVEVVVTAGATDEEFSSGIVPIAPGLNEVTLDVALSPVRLQLGGVMSDGDGDPLAGPVPVSVVFRSATDAYLGGQVLLAQPDPDTGAYSLTFTGHRQATRAVVTITPEAGSDFTTTFDGLAQGDNPRVFDIGFNPPVVILSGRMTGPTGAPLADSQLVRLLGTRADTTTFSQLVAVTLDAEGDYTVSRAFPVDTVKLRARVELGPAVDWYHSDEIDLVPGSNFLSLDVDHRPPVLTVSGTMVSAPGVGLAAPFVPGPIPLGVYSFDADDVLIGYSQPSITPTASGAYSTTLTLPRRTASVQARAFISGEDFVTELDGITIGSTPVLDFDVAYHPARLNLQGTALVDGSPATGLTAQITLTTPDGTGGWSLSLPVGPGGGFSRQNILLPLATTAVTVKLQPAGGAAHTQTVELVEHGSVYTLDFDIDDVSTQLQVSGTFKVFDEVPGSNYMYATPLDADRQPLSSGVVVNHVAIDPDDGSYTTTFLVPAEAVYVSLVIGLTSPSTYLTEYPTFEVAVQSGQVTQATWDWNSMLLRVTGTLVDNGVRAELPDDLTFEVQVRNGPHTIDVYEVTASYGVFDNSFDFLVMLPGETQAATVVLTSVDPPQPALQVEGLSPGIHDREWHIDLATISDTGVVVTGQFLDGGFPLPFFGDPYGVTVEIVGLRYVDGSTPLVEVARQTFTGLLSADTSAYGFAMDLPETATMVKVAVSSPGIADDPWLRTFLLTPGIVNPITFDVELSPSRLRISGDTVLEDCPAPLVFTREVWLFDSEPTAAYDWGSGTWPGGTLLGSYLVAPEVTAPYRHDLTVHLPSATAWVGLVLRTHNSGGTGTFQIDPDSFVGIGADEHLSC